ncbi:hypothetical protein CCR97_21760 [Rhodoplanes elegans]|uniref:Uncharacterized protein n=1 Tax=Rhodoplanes elegans TaxID=29408 RepID=A0A327K6Y6_9BRAD|nr:hypothetical protein [Rhodoplanes elegans]MBK5960810.1 hypothetical protein [Rhodoplanes elegans]RAI33684.1 hypothetical protein CH338_22155 [Rhodoplanes elegans]
MPTPVKASPKAHTVPVVIPRGHDHFWAVIRELDKRGSWTVSDIDGASNAIKSNIHDFVRRLVAGGIARVDIRRPSGAATYRLITSPTVTPRLRRDGTQAPPSAQQQLWNAMRQLGQFTWPELAMAASTDELIIGALTGRSYVARLVAAGYLVAVVPGGPGKLAVWKLKPGMNTGPKAPRILRAHVVFDPNRNAVMGAAAAEEVSS